MLLEGICYNVDEKFDESGQFIYYEFEFSPVFMSMINHILPVQIVELKIRNFRIYFYIN